MFYIPSGKFRLIRLCIYGASRLSNLSIVHFYEKGREILAACCGDESGAFFGANRPAYRSKVGHRHGAK
jgi:hypothetical protein